MDKLNSTAILASFATMKSLFDSKSYRNPYQLLSEFISCIITSEKLYVFSASEMRNRISENFGFEVPEAVVKTSTKNLNYISCVNNQFIVNSNNMNENVIFNEKRLNAESINSDIIELLYAYVTENKHSNVICLEKLTQEFVAFLIDDESRSDCKYTEIISQFIIENEGNKKIQDALTLMREGAILYIGLNYNINETGSIRKPLSLYLGTEVLFSLYGLNGEIHKRLALDLYEQIKLANFSDKKISLRYFSEIKKEIDDFFASAESIVGGDNVLYDTVAMKAIVNGCKTVGDVRVKKADFYHSLQYQYKIKEDEKTDYYSENNMAYNLESLDNDETSFDSVQLVSHINKLRKGYVYNHNLESEYLIVTNSRNTINASKNQSNQDKIEYELDLVNDYAVTVEKMTNLLWYKLGNGFGGKEYPSNVDAVIKARTILASHISQNVSKIYAETKSEFKAGIITKEQLEARIIALRGKTTVPEELNADTIEETMNFSNEYFSKFEEEVRSNRLIAEEKNQVILQKEQLLLEKDKRNRELEAEVEQFRLRDQNKKEKRKKILRFIWSIVWKILIVIGITVVAIFVCRKVNPEITTIICSIVDVIGLIVIGCTTLKKDINKYFPKDE